MSRSRFSPRLFSTLSNYSPSLLAKDTASGITVGLIALPLALALGIASIPAGTVTPFPAPALGLFTAILAGFLISAFGGSKVQIGGPTAAFVPIVLLIVEKHGYQGLILSTILAGIILVIMGLARLGTIIKFIPWPVTSGFTTGIAVSLMATQIADISGLSSIGAIPREFTEKMGWIFEHITQVNMPTLAIGVFSLAGILLWPKLGLKKIPGSIVFMLGATVVVSIFGLTASGVETIGSKFGENAIPRSLPPFQFPHVTLELISDLFPSAITIALLGAIESLLSAVVADGLSGDRHDSNTELVAQGIANIVCPFFGGLPATGAIARTSANVSNGAQTPVSGIIHAITLLAIVLIFAKFAIYIPVAVMAAILFAVAIRMGEWHELTRLRQMTRSDAVVLVLTAILTILFDLVVAVEVGMLCAVILFVSRVAATTEVSRVTSDDVLESPEQMAQGKIIPDGVVVYRIFGPFLFGAAEKMEDALIANGTLPKVLILRLHLVTAIDSTALNALTSVVERMKRSGGTVIISGIHRQPLAVFMKAGFVEVLGMENLCATFDDSLVRANKLLAEA